MDGDFDYDDGGRQRSGGGRKLEYTHFDQPKVIDDATGTTRLEYDAANTRARKTFFEGASSATTDYVAGIYEHRTVGGQHTHVFYVTADDTNVVAQVTYTPTGIRRSYVVPDHLGTASVIMSDTGQVEKSYFDPFGGRIGEQGQAISDPDKSTTIGFTGHEHDADDLINMGGRLYDRDQYRFLSPDPIVSAPLFGQSHNPYAYALNNPLRYTDPSGFQTTEGQEDVAGPPAPVTSGGTFTIVICTGGEYCKNAPPTGGVAEAPVATDGKGGSTGPSGLPRGQGRELAIALGSQLGVNPPAGEDVKAAISGAIAYNNERWEATRPMREQVAHWYGRNLSTPAEDQRMWNVSGAGGASPIGYGYYGPRSWAELGHTRGIDEAAIIAPGAVNAIQAGRAVFDELRASLQFWQIVADTRGGGTFGTPATAYSVAFEAVIPRSGAGTRAAHFKAANEELLRAAARDPALAAALRHPEVLGPGFETTILTPAGTVLGKSPASWTWHHVIGRPGTLHLSPIGQHRGAAWQQLFHPGRTGGFAEWGHLY